MLSRTGLRNCASCGTRAEEGITGTQVLRVPGTVRNDWLRWSKLSGAIYRSRAKSKSVNIKKRLVELERRLTSDSIDRKSVV